MEESLKRPRRTSEVLFIDINVVIGGGIFLLPGQVAGLADDRSMFADLLAGVIAVLIGLSFSEASSMFTTTVCSFVYAERAMEKTVAFTVGWMSWLTFVIGWASLSNGLVSYIAVVSLDDRDFLDAT